MAAGDVLDETATSGPALPRAGESFRAGDQIRRYVVERTLGAGGMGVVYAAHDPDLDRRIAVKVLRGDASPESRTRLLREARAMAKVSHANVITVYEVGSAGDVDFVAMELVDGGSLAEWLRGARRPLRDVLRVFRAAGRGLAAAHASGLVHRDFKPGNVLLGRDGKVVVTDFGLARGFEAEALASTVATPDPAPVTPASSGPIGLDVTLAAESTAGATRPPRDADVAEAPARGARARLDSADLSSTLTRTGALLGTPAYMAPEQFAGQHVGPAADQFSFAVALWEGLAGERPFRGNTLDELRAAVGKPPTGAGQVPRGLRTILLRALARQPAQRWRDLDAMIDAIDRAERRPRRLAILAGITLATAGAALAYTLHEPQRVAGPVAPRTAACALTDDDLTSAWSPAIAARIGQHFADAPEWTKTRTLLDDYAGKWRAERATICAEPTDRMYHGRVACLASLRDELEAATTLVAQVPIEALRGPGLGEMLSMPAVCRSGQRAAMTPLPDDPKVRAALSEIIRTGAMARFTARGGDDHAADAAATMADANLVKARALGYPPALAIALEARATVAHIADHYGAAMQFYEETATAAEAAGADGIRAMARIGQLECAIQQSSDLASIQQYADKAEAAIQRAGDDPILRAALDTTLAGVAATTGDLDGAIERTAAARVTFLANHDARRAANALAAEAGYRELRANPGDDVEALALTRAAFDQTVAAYGDGHPITEQARMALGLRLVDTAPEEGRALIATAAASHPIPPPPPDAVHVRGHVATADGTVPAGAKVFASRALLTSSDGDPLPVANGGYATAAVGADGRFDLVTVPNAMLYASAPGWSVEPRRAPDTGAVELRFEPAASVAITITSEHPTAPAGAERAVALGAHVAEVGLAMAHVDNGSVYQTYARRTSTSAWAVESTGAGHVHIMLIAQTALGDTIMAGLQTTLRAGVANPIALSADLRGQVIDVIVRADRDAAIPTAEVLVLPGRLRRMPHTNLDLYNVIGVSPRVHVTIAVPVVDATRTQAGAADYLPGDIHGRLAAIPVGPVTICVLPFAGDVRDQSFMKPLAGADDLEVRCSVVTVAATPGSQAFVVETPPMKRRPAAPEPAPPIPPTPPPAPPAP